MSIRNEVKSFIAKEGLTIVSVAESIDKKYNTGMTSRNLGQKLARESIRYKELLQVADVLGYEIKWVKKETDD